MSLKLSSDAFRDGGKIPDRYSRSGGNASPPLAWSGVPASARSLALIVDDPDAAGGLFVHWVVYGIPTKMDGFPENVPPKAQLPRGILQGRNGFGELGYGGPQPPSGTHRYFFHLYALDEEVRLAGGADREDLDKAMRGHIVEEARLMGTFEHRTGSRAA
jgi:Raf kinase inhibitor-like YbhB/YbcL family protein